MTTVGDLLSYAVGVSVAMAAEAMMSASQAGLGINSISVITWLWVSGLAIIAWFAANAETLSGWTAGDGEEKLRTRLRILGSLTGSILAAVCAQLAGAHAGAPELLNMLGTVAAAYAGGEWLKRKFKESDHGN